MKKPKKPPSVVCGPLHARVVRGPRADGRWYWRSERRGAGERETVWTGWATAEEVVPELARVFAEGGPVAPLGPADCRTVRDLLELWLGSQALRADLAERSQRGRVQAATRIAASIGSVEVAKIDRAALNGLHAARLRAGSAPSTIQLDLTLLRIAWVWGREEGIAPDRDLPRIRIRVPKIERSAPPPEDIARIAEWLDANRRPRWPGRLVRLLAATGCRIGEVADLRWGAIDLDRGVVAVAGKTGPRRVPIHPEVVAWLRSWRPATAQPEDRVWGREVVRPYLSVALKAAGENLGLTGLTPHAIRRSAVDQLYRSGVDVGVAAAILGHSPAMALACYRRANGADLKAASLTAGLGRASLPPIPPAHSPGAQIEENRPCEPV